MSQTAFPILLFFFLLAAAMPCIHSTGTACAETVPPQGPEPHLLFKKTVVVNTYEDGQAHAEPHVVKQGDHLWKILREQYHMSDTRINFFCKVVKAINPDIEDLNVLHPSQSILLPFKFIPGDGSDNSTIMIGTQDYRHVVSRGEHLGYILRTRFNLPDSVIFSRITKSLIQDANPDIADLNTLAPGQEIIFPREIFAMQQIIAQGAIAEERLLQPEQETQSADRPRENNMAADEPLSEEELEIKHMLSMMTRQFAGTDNSTGHEMLSHSGNETITLDYTRFPAYNFPWGKKIVFDYGGKLPEDMRAVISERWENAEVVSVQARDDMESIIGRVLDVCGLYKIEKDGDYTVSRDAIQLSVTGNWLVFKDSSLRNVFVVSLVQDGKPLISPALRSYLADMGLEMVDIGPGAEGAADQGPDAAKMRPKAPYTKIDHAPVVLTDTILRMLSIDFQTEYKTSIFQNMFSGFSLEVMADRMFQKNGVTHLIDFNSLPRRITDIITQQGFKLLQITPGEESSSCIAGRVLDFCGADYQAPPVTLAFERGSRQTVRLTMPGYVVQASDGRKLLTDMDINEAISDFLREMAIEIVNY